jgi:mono/diheme cytochrome c family protein
MQVSKVLAFCLALAPTAALAQGLSKGEYLARASDCVVCHTLPEGRPYAGGLKMNTPVGAIYTTNITPDAETGIGRYSLEEFERAVRKGVARDGHRLYPAMPYPSYARLTDEDVRALYDFFMKEVKPVRQRPTPNDLAWPMTMRWPLAMWNWIGTDAGPFRPDDRFDAAWNRGAYLVQGPGHCGACHTPRGFAFQEKALDDRSGAFLAGGNLDNWSAPNLRNDLNTGLGRWTEEDVAKFLKTGQNRYGTAFGTMRDVVNYSTRFMSDEDVASIAKYLKSLSPSIDRTQPVWVYDNRTTEALTARRFETPGAATFQRQCASCHGSDGKGGGNLPALAGNPAILDPDGTSLINIVLNGAHPLDPEGLPEADWMPQFRTFLSDKDVADVVSFIRSGWGNRAAAVSPAAVEKLRKETALGERTVILHMR